MPVPVPLTIHSPSSPFVNPNAYRSSLAIALPKIQTWYSDTHPAHEDWLDADSGYSITAATVRDSRSSSGYYDHDHDQYQYQGLHPLPIAKALNSFSKSSHSHLHGLTAKDNRGPNINMVLWSPPNHDTTDSGDSHWPPLPHPQAHAPALSAGCSPLYADRDRRDSSDSSGSSDSNSSHVVDVWTAASTAAAGAAPNSLSHPSHVGHPSHLSHISNPTHPSYPSYTRYPGQLRVDAYPVGSGRGGGGGSHSPYTPDDDMPTCYRRPPWQELEQEMEMEQEMEDDSPYERERAREHVHAHEHESLMDRVLGPQVMHVLPPSVPEHSSSSRHNSGSGNGSAKHHGETSRDRDSAREADADTAELIMNTDDVPTYRRLAEPLSDWLADYVWKVCTTGLSLPAHYVRSRVSSSGTGSGPHTGTAAPGPRRIYSMVPPADLCHSIRTMLCSALLQSSDVFLALWYVARLPVFLDWDCDHDGCDIDDVGQEFPREHAFRAELFRHARKESCVPFRVLLLGFMLANKWLDDHTFSNKTWHTISDVPVQQINKLESLALSVLTYDLSVPVHTWDKWLADVREYNTSVTFAPTASSSPSYSSYSLQHHSYNHIRQHHPHQHHHSPYGSPIERPSGARWGPALFVQRLIDELQGFRLRLRLRLRSPSFDTEDDLDVDLEDVEDSEDGDRNGSGNGNGEMEGDEVDGQPFMGLARKRRERRGKIERGEVVFVNEGSGEGEGERDLGVVDEGMGMGLLRPERSEVDAGMAGVGAGMGLGAASWSPLIEPPQAMIWEREREERGRGRDIYDVLSHPHPHSHPHAPPAPLLHAMPAQDVRLPPIDSMLAMAAPISVPPPPHPLTSLPSIPAMQGHGHIQMQMQMQVETPPMTPGRDGPRTGMDWDWDCQCQVCVEEGRGCLGISSGQHQHRRGHQQTGSGHQQTGSGHGHGHGMSIGRQLDAFPAPPQQVAYEWYPMGGRGDGRAHSQAQQQEATASGAYGNACPPLPVSMPVPMPVSMPMQVVPGQVQVMSGQVMSATGGTVPMPLVPMSMSMSTFGMEQAEMERAYHHQQQQAQAQQQQAQAQAQAQSQFPYPSRTIHYSTSNSGSQPSSLRRRFAPYPGVGQAPASGHSHQIHGQGEQQQHHQQHHQQHQHQQQQQVPVSMGCHYGSCAAEAAAGVEAGAGVDMMMMERYRRGRMPVGVVRTR